MRFMHIQLYGLFKKVIEFSIDGDGFHLFSGSYFKSCTARQMKAKLLSEVTKKRNPGYCHRKPSSDGAQYSQDSFQIKEFEKVVILCNCNCRQSIFNVDNRYTHPKLHFSAVIDNF